MDFRWNDWNWEHAQEHGVSPEEAEWVVERAKPPYPTRREDHKWLVWGPATGGRWIQVIYLIDPEGTLFVIHARPLTEREKQQYRRRSRP